MKCDLILTSLCDQSQRNEYEFYSVLSFLLLISIFVCGLFEERDDPLVPDDACEDPILDDEILFREEVAGCF